MKKIKRYRLFLILLLGLFLIAFVNQSIAVKTVHLTSKSILDMLFLLPPIFLLVGLLDQWVKKESLIRYMGENSGIYGIIFTLLLATVAAGPLYIAFPIAVLLLKKGASIRYIVFFLGAWSTVKLPVLVYEFTSFGSKFTLIHICFGLGFYYLTGIVFEKIFDKQKLLKYDITKDV
ncbi:MULTISPECIES: permease [unclassified Bacillus (in: firmicutes)]|uniref:permease n=1 Tax=unclassified Bacillus (in: firmicutes) TaxID=185979 RepID=UPI0008EE193C|nr:MULTISPECIES: permease [unclassified Bacillus (in: firmicutes)]SFA85199.1 Predicted permease [Bacillus sp. UNCCL13]SFQ83304.1 Predicted permease [Bacillus sp. cl95]